MSKLREWMKGHPKIEWLIFNAAYPFAHVEDPSNHLGEVQAFLAQGGNLIIYANHIAYDDPAIIGKWYAGLFNPDGKRHIIIPASHYHMNPEINPKFAEAAEMAKRLYGVEIFPLIQPYMVGNPAFGNYTEEDARANSYAFFKRLKELGRAGIPVDMIIFPEGHRSEDGTVGPVEGGFTLAGDLLKPSVFLPVGIHYGPGGYSREHMNYAFRGRLPHLAIGAPYFLEKDGKRPSAELLMHNLVTGLPPHMRGKWG